ncbi:MAG TPA: aldehyde dehydrogenase family protein, partial [Steroidobacteraceae bacterium]|nr:aldehyde dehydrogenase family protein [Steroidobacteraceae bacterium]
MTVQTTQAVDWHQRARQLIANKRIAYQAYIDGRYVDAQDGQTFDCISPIDGALLVKIASCGDRDVDAAISAARHSVIKGTWLSLSPSARKNILLKFADLIDQHAEELALLETLDMGKPIRYSLAVDIPAVLKCIRWYAEAID